MSSRTMVADDYEAIRNRMNELYDNQAKIITEEKTEQLFPNAFKQNNRLVMLRSIHNSCACNINMGHTCSLEDVPVGDIKLSGICKKGNLT